MRPFRKLLHFFILVGFSRWLIRWTQDLVGYKGSVYFSRCELLSVYLKWTREVFIYVLSILVFTLLFHLIVSVFMFWSYVVMISSVTFKSKVNFCIFWESNVQPLHFKHSFLLVDALIRINISAIIWCSLRHEDVLKKL